MSYNLIVQLLLSALLTYSAMPGCASVNSATPDSKHPVVLYVSSQVADIDPVDISVTIDGEHVVQDDFTFGDGHSWKTFHLSLSQGIHQINARSIAGKAILDVVFEVKGKRWLALDYWGEGHFQLGMFDEPVSFE